MSINIPIPQNIPGDLYQCLEEICRRSFDATTQFNFQNTINVTNGDVKIVTAGKGLILPNRAGTAYYRLVVENDGSLALDGPL